MGRLLNPSPGDILDRVTILELKIRVALKQRKDPDQWLAEKLELEERMLQWDSLLKDDNPPVSTWELIKKTKEELATVNALLWDVEDEVRMLPDEEMSKLAFVAKRMAKLNDKRMELVQKIAGIYKAHEGEKLYTKKTSGVLA